jgi:hypothetical protein
MDQSKIKALRDRLHHLKAGRRADAPVHDKTIMKEVNDDSLLSPHLANPFKQTKLPEAELPKMFKSDHRDSIDKDLDMILKVLEAECIKEKEFAKNSLPCTEDHVHTAECGNKTPKMQKSEPFGKPFASEAQRRAMYAAAEGNSTIGIPKKVGKEYVSASKDQDTSKLPEKVEKGKILEGKNDLYKNLRDRLELQKKRKVWMD